PGRSLECAHHGERFEVQRLREFLTIPVGATPSPACAAHRPPRAKRTAVSEPDSKVVARSFLFLSGRGFVPPVNYLHPLSRSRCHCERSTRNAIFVPRDWSLRPRSLLTS